MIAEVKKNHPEIKFFSITRILEPQMKVGLVSLV